MAFPTIPTGGRVLTTNQADTSGTRTFPSLSSLTKNKGDLLVAIIVGYQSTAGAFSTWGAGFTEFTDQFTSTTLAIGAAWKISDGTETGTFTVTQSATITGHASMILLSIPDGMTPEAGTIANGTSAAADPGAFNPAGWDAEDTLWISVLASGMTSATGTWTATGSTTPTNYSDRVDTNTADNSTVGQTELAVAFRQLNAASEDAVVSGMDTSNARNSALLIAVRPAYVKTGAGIAPFVGAGVNNKTVGRQNIAISPFVGSGADAVTLNKSGTASRRTGNQRKKFTASDAASGDNFGISIAVSGDGSVIVIGAYLEDGAGNARGAAYVYSGANWNTETKLTASDAADADNFGWSVAVNGDGSVVAAGADTEGTNANGAVYVYSGSNWSTETKLIASDTQTGDHFGYSVALNESGSIVAVGAQSEDGAGTNRGAAYVYSGTNWGTETKLTASDAADNDDFGFSIAISGDGRVVVVGADLEDGAGTNRGAAYVYSGANWGTETKLTASDAADNYGFGRAVATSGDGSVVAVGATVSPTHSTGAAYMYTGASWGTETKLTASDAASGDLFGYSIALSKDGASVVVGAQREDGAGTDRGAVYLRSGSGWGTETKMIASDAVNSDLLGTSVSASADAKIVASGANGRSSGTGVAYAFTVPEHTGTGASAVTYVETGTGLTARVASGAEETISSRTDIGISPFTASGVSEKISGGGTTYTKAGIALRGSSHWYHVDWHDFEDNSLARYDTVTGTPSIQTSVVYEGARAVRFNPSSSQQYLEEALPASYDRAAMQVYIRRAHAAGESPYLFFLINSSGGRGIYVQHESTAGLRLVAFDYEGGPGETVLDVYGAWTINEWTKFDVILDGSASTWRVAWKVNDVSQGEFTIGHQVTTWSKIRMGVHNYAMTWDAYFDRWAVWDRYQYIDRGQSESAVTYNRSGIAISNGPSYREQVRELSPSSHWKLDEPSGSTADDAMDAVNGTYQGTPGYSATSLVQNDSGTSVDFVPADADYVDFGNNYDFTGSTQFTAVCWVDLDAYDSGNGHYIWGNTDGSARGWGLNLGNPGVTIYGLRGDNAGFDQVSYQVDETAFETGAHMVALTYDGTDLKIYYDGAFVASQPSSKSVVAPTTNTTLQLGRYSGGGSGFDGKLDEPALWSGVALSETALDDLYAVGTGGPRGFNASGHKGGSTYNRTGTAKSRFHAYPTTFTTGLLDTFTGSDENPITTNWTSPFPGYNDARRLSNQFAGTAASDWNGAYYDVAEFGPDAEAYVSLPTAPVGGSACAVWARMTTPATPSGYAAHYEQGTPGNLYLFRNVLGTGTQIGSASATLSDGDKIGIRCIGATIEAWAHTSGSWTKLVTAYDASVSAAGSPVLTVHNTLARLDDLGGGTVVVSDAGRSAVTYVESGTASSEFNCDVIYPAATVLDDFNRSNGAVGSNWTVDPYGWGANGFDVESNRLRATSAQAQMFWNVASYGPNAEMSVRVPVLPGSNQRLWLYARGDEVADSGYAAAYQQGVGFWVVRFLEDVETYLVSAGGSLSADDKFGVRVTGKAIQVLVNDAVVLTAHDSNLKSAGRFVIYIEDTTTRLDDFSGGTATRNRGDSQVTYVESGTAATGGSHYVAEVLADDPEAYYRFDESSGAPQDFSGSGLHLTTISGSPDYRQTGPFPAAFGIRLGSGERFQRLAAVATTVTDDFTLEIWAQLVSCSTDGRTLFANGTENPGGWEIDVDIDGTFHYARDNGAQAGADSVAVLDGTWKLIHVVRRAGVTEYYVDGNLDTNAAGGGTPGTPSGNIQVGAGTGLDVHVAHAAIYDTALTSARIKRRYQSARDGMSASGVAEKISGGGNEYVKAGVGVSAFVGSGTDAVTFAETGAGVAPFTASGADAVTLSRTGVGTAPFTASGTRQKEAGRTGAAVSEFVGSGADAVTFAETGSATSEFTGAGDGRWETTEAGAGVSPFTASGGDSITYTETGAAVINDFIGSGDATTAIVKLGAGVAGFVASGADAITFAEAGAGISAFAASGADATTFAESGAGIVNDLIASGSDAVTFAEAGAGIVEFTGSGVRAREIARTGAAVANFTASGADAAEHAEAGAGVIEFVASGTSQLSGGAEYVKAGAAISEFTAASPGDEVQVNAGAGVSAFIASGDDATTSSETGAGVAPFTGSGARSVDHLREGAGVSPFIGSGVDASTFNRSGAAVINDLIASGADAVTFTETGSATSAFTASGADSITFVEAGAGISGFTGAGADASTLSGSGAAESGFTGTGDGQWALDRTGAGVVGFTCSGAGAKQGEPTGSGTSGFTGGGDAESTLNRTNVAVAPLIGSGADSITFVEAGVAIAPFTAAGTRAVEHLRAGAAISAFTGEGDGQWEVAETGAGITAFVASATPDYELNRSGAAIIGATASGSAAGEGEFPGTAASGFTGEGDSRITYVESGAAIQGREASGTYALECLRVGSGIVNFSGTGTVAGDRARAGAAILNFTGSIFDELELDRVGVGVINFIGSGESEPGFETKAGAAAMIMVGKGRSGKKKKKSHAVGGTVSGPTTEAEVRPRQ